MREVQNDEAWNIYIDPKTGRVDVAILTTGISSGERRLRADLAQTMKRYLKEQKSSLSSQSMKKDQLFHDMRDRGDEQITRDMFDDAIRALEEENFLVATTHTIRLVTLGESNFDWETKGNEWARCRLCVGENIDLVLFFLYTYYWMQNEYRNKRSFLSRAMKSSVVLQTQRSWRRNNSAPATSSIDIFGAGLTVMDSIHSFFFQKHLSHSLVFRIDESCTVVSIDLLLLLSY